MKTLYEQALRAVKRTYPAMDADEQQALAGEWAAERAQEIAEREDTPTIEDRIPEEALALRRELRDGDG